MSDGEDETGVHARVQTRSGRLLASSGRPQMQVAAELGIQPSMVRQWRAALNGSPPRQRPAGSTGASPPNPVASPSDQAAEIVRLRRELDRPRMERDVLKEAIGNDRSRISPGLQARFNPPPHTKFCKRCLGGTFRQAV